MTRILRRKAAVVTLAALALALAGGGVAVAKPAAKAPTEVVQPGARGTQPPVTAEAQRSAKAEIARAADEVGANLHNVYGTVVNANGTKARGWGTVIKYGVGQYEVQFGVNVASGVYAATIGRADSCCIPPAGEVSVAPRLLTPTAVFIQTYNSAGVPADRPFHLIVHS
ncbi:hypothetical protein GA0070616_3958 [Micromonospora nigra]|uniref:Uncharacterized protein n=1 Tax=Micromonospora nigra TaxID=145857 RepID=A0A1C6SJT8_9ACTN|nr:hypothetical protein [Micromonospora nigra]SCL29830.1 hypothetical protein GA0070616_3958 [Micromonospora nigra]